MSTLKKISCCFFFCIAICLNISAQKDSSFIYDKFIPGDFTYFTVDNLDNIYLLTGSDELKKIQENGDSVAVFNDVRTYGKLFSIDATNPLKILLYYKNFSTVVVLVLSVAFCAYDNPNPAKKKTRAIIIFFIINLFLRLVTIRILNYQADECPQNFN